ncbi:MAG: hypothetical protein ACRDIC_07110 [bacterium]
MKQPEDRPNPAEHVQQVKYDNPQGCLLRLFWMAFGNLALLVLILSISSRHGFTLLDGLYWVVVTALASVRYIDITRFAGLTVDGTPATKHHFRRYATWLFVVAMALWIATHLLQRVL